MPKLYFKRYEVRRAILEVNIETLEDIETGEAEELSYDYVCLLEQAGDDLVDGLIEPKDYKLYEIEDDS